MDQLDTIQVQIGDLHKSMGLPENFQDVESRMVQWHREEGNHSTIAIIDIADEGDEMRLEFSRAAYHNGVKQGMALQFSAWYIPDSNALYLIDEGAGDMESMFNAFQADFSASDLIPQD